jgi:hypothetical protein
MVGDLGLRITLTGTSRLRKLLPGYDILVFLRRYFSHHGFVSLKAVYKQEPDLTREGGSIPVTLTFAESLGVNVCLLPMGRGDDGAQYVYTSIFLYHCVFMSFLLPLQLN